MIYCFTLFFTIAISGTFKVNRLSHFYYQDGMPLDLIIDDLTSYESGGNSSSETPMWTPIGLRVRSILKYHTMGERDEYIVM